MDINAEVAAIQAASQGSELRQPLVGALNKLNTGTLPAVTVSDTGKILRVGANGWEVGEKSGYMPVPTATKQITENGTHDVTDYASAVVNVSGGGSGGEHLFWCGGEYYGQAIGDVTNSINVTLSKTFGNVAILIVMHRSSLTVPSNFILVDNRINPTPSTSSTRQEISIYKIILSSASETYTISQADSVRMCACCYYFSDDPNLEYYDTLEMDTTSNTYLYSIPNAVKPTLVIISNVYTRSASDVINTMEPVELCVMPKTAYSWFNSPQSNYVGFRLIAIINNSPNRLVITSNINNDQGGQDTNRVYVYTIG